MMMMIDIKIGINVPLCKYPLAFLFFDQNIFLFQLIWHYVILTICLLIQYFYPSVEQQSHIHVKVHFFHIFVSKRTPVSLICVTFHCTFLASKSLLATFYYTIMFYITEKCFGIGIILKNFNFIPLKLFFWGILYHKISL